MRAAAMAHRAKAQAGLLVAKPTQFMVLRYIVDTAGGAVIVTMAGRGTGTDLAHTIQSIYDDPHWPSGLPRRVERVGKRPTHLARSLDEASAGPKDA